MAYDPNSDKVIAEVGSFMLDEQRYNLLIMQYDGKGAKKLWPVKAIERKNGDRRNTPVKRMTLGEAQGFMPLYVKGMEMLLEDDDKSTKKTMRRQVEEDLTKKTKKGK